MAEPISIASTSSTATMSAGDQPVDDDKMNAAKAEVDHTEDPIDRLSTDMALPKRPWRRRPTGWTDIINHPYRGSGTDTDPFIVTWLPQDSENPMKWPTGYKWVITIMGESNVGVAALC